MKSSLNPEIEQALGPLVSSLAKLSYTPSKSSVSSAFGNFAVSFRGPGQEFQIARDRGQFIVSGPSQQELEQAGLWRAFHGVSELAQPLLQWVASEA